jgi:hypothetical protein
MRYLCLIRAEKTTEQMPVPVAESHSNRLLPPATAATVRVGDGRISTTDGPPGR